MFPNITRIFFQFLYILYKRGISHEKIGGNRNDFIPSKSLSGNLDFHKPTLHEELIQTRRALENAYSGFDNVTDPDLIDCYIYEVNAVMKRYKYLLEQAAKNNLLPEETYSETYHTLLPN